MVLVVEHIISWKISEHWCTRLWRHAQGSSKQCCIDATKFAKKACGMSCDRASYISHSVWGGPESKVHGANMGLSWDGQHPGRPYVGPMNLAIYGVTALSQKDGPFHPRHGQLEPDLVTFHNQDILTTANPHDNTCNVSSGVILLQCNIYGVCHMQSLLWP